MIYELQMSMLKTNKVQTIELELRAFEKSAVRITYCVRNKYF